jgi:hypothetical protein
MGTKTRNARYEWELTYHEALLETDWTKIEPRIQAAEAAMREKLHDFSLNHGGTAEENRAIEDALHGLNILRKEVAEWLGSKRANVSTRCFSELKNY